MNKHKFIMEHIPEEVKEKYRTTKSSFDFFYESLPEEIELKIKIGKNVWKEMYERTQEQESGIVDERHVLNDWILGCIRHEQKGIKFFYENGSNKGIPSVRFLDSDGNELPLDKLDNKPYKNTGNDNDYSTND